MSKEMIAAITAITVLFVPICITFITYTISKRRKNNHLAIKVLIHLNEFVAGCRLICLSWVQIGREGRDRGAYNLRNDVNFHPETVTEDWGSFPIGLRNEILKFASDIAIIDNEISLEPCDSSEAVDWAHDTTKYHYAKFGLSGLRLQKTISGHFKIGELEFGHDADDDNLFKGIIHERKHLYE